MDDVDVTRELEDGEGESASDAIATGRPALRYVIGGVLIVAAVAGAVIGFGATGNSSAGAAAIVRQALTSTLATNSIAFKEDATFSVAGQSISATGGGVCALTTEDCSITVNYGGALSVANPLNEVLSGGVLYMEFGPGLSSKLPTPWVSLPFSLMSKSNSWGATGNPLSGLSLLAKEGAVVTDVGAVTVNSTSMHEYKIVLSGSAVHRLVKKNVEGLPKWMVDAASKVTSGDVTETVDVNAAGKLAVIDMSLTETVQGQTVTIGLTATVTGYGVPVNVTVPPSNQVTPITSLNQLNSL